jgi:hypothetical protein
MATYNNGLVIVDSGNMRIAILNNDGRQLKAFKIFKSYSEIAVSNDGKNIYVSSLSRDDHPIEVLNTEGRNLGGFGEMLNFKNRNRALNDIFLQRNSAGEIWAAWKYFPIIRRYSPGGQLLNEYKVHDPSLAEFIQANETVSNATTGSNRIRLIGIISGFFLSDHSYYALICGKNAQPRIAEYNYQGEQLAVYEVTDNVDREFYLNFVVQEQNKNKAFFILQGSPEARVDVYKPAFQISK